MSDTIPHIDIGPHEKEKLQRLVNSEDWQLIKDVCEKIRTRWLNRLLETKDEEDEREEKAKIKSIRPLLSEIEYLSGLRDDETGSDNTMDGELV